MSDIRTVHRSRMRRRLALPYLGRDGAPDRGSAADTDSVDAALRAWALLVEPGGHGGMGARDTYRPIALAACRLAYDHETGFVVIVDGEARWVADDVAACRLAMSARHAARILSLDECRTPVAPPV